MSAKAIESLFSKKQDFFNKKKIIKLALIASAVFLVIYLIVSRTGLGSANFIISDKEIDSAGEPVKIKDLKSSSRLYFYAGKRIGSIGADRLEVVIEKGNGSDYKPYKKIEFEMESSFDKIAAYIPEQYFKKSGKYRIKGYLDGKSIGSYDINVQ